MQLDLTRARREHLRWIILLTLNNARPLGHYDSPMLAVAQAIYPDSTLPELRREVDYLAERKLLEWKALPSGQWHCKLLRDGVDVVEYTVDCDPGIARPVKYI